MGADTKIPWCHHTQNFWIGCVKKSEACKHCYAEVETYPRVQRAAGRELWGHDADRHITSDANWRKPYTWDRAAAAAGERHRVFVNSMSDFFEKRDDLEIVRAQAWAMIKDCPHLDWLLLTKRPENIRDMLPIDWGDGWPHVWFGATAETQERLAERWQHLAQVPGAAVRYVSVEPQLEDMDLTAVRWQDDDAEILCNALTGEAWVANSASPSAYTDTADGNAHLDWVIVGGESGPRARAFDVMWAESIVRQCRDAGVAVFVKQLGANAEHPMAYDAKTDSLRVRLRDRKGGDPSEWPEDLRIREFPTMRT